MSHSAKALVLHCMDFRFVAELRDYLVAQGLDGQYDLVCAAGAAKNLADPKSPGDADFMFWHIEIAKQLHGVAEVWLINHKDCGAYGKIFASTEEELARHTADLANAQSLIEERFPGLTVKTRLAELGADGRVTVNEA